MSLPTRRAVLAVCVALLLVTAGCTTGATPTSTTTPTPTSTWSPNASVDQYPPGVADNGTLTNVSALADAHFEATANEPMVFTQQLELPNETIVRSYARGASPTPYYSTSNRTTDEIHTTEQFYSTGSHGYSRVTIPNRTGYQVMQNDTAIVGPWTRDDIFGPQIALENAFISGNYSVNGTVERGGRTFVQLTADEPSPTDWGTSLTSYEGTALVTPDGVVYDTEQSFVRDRDDTTKRVNSSITLETGIDWSGPPSWVGDVPHLSLSIVEDGHAFEIRNTGGVTLPANASFRVGGSNEYAMDHVSIGDEFGTVTTDAPLEPGDAVYVTASADGNSKSVTLHDDPTRGEYTFVTASVAGTHEPFYYQLVTSDKSRERARETTSSSN
jgi:hypothetical protein